MTQEKVISLGKDIMNMGEDWIFYLGIALVFIGFMTMFVLLLLQTSDPIIGFIVIIFGVLSIIYSMIHEETEKNNAWSEWKKEVASPYVEALPITKVNIDSVQLNKNVSVQEDKNKFYTNTKDENKERKTPVIVSFLEEGSTSLTTVTDFYKTKKDLDNGEKPYVTYQYVDKKLGRNMDKGFYNLEIHLPKDYSFGNK